MVASPPSTCRAPESRAEAEAEAEAAALKGAQSAGGQIRAAAAQLGVHGAQMQCVAPYAVVALPRAKYTITPLPDIAM